MVCGLVPISLDSHELGILLDKHFKVLIQRYAKIWIFRSPSHFVYDFPRKMFFMVCSTRFFLPENFLEENEPQKPQNLKKMLRKSRASNGWAAIFKNAAFS